MTVAPILFVSREPVTRERNGSTAAVGNLLSLLRRHGAPVTVLVTTGASRSPRLFFRSAIALPAGCVMRVPGYLRVGAWFMRPFRGLAWMRLAARALRRSRQMESLRCSFEGLAGDRLFTNTWDLTEPTEAERAMVVRAIKTLRPAVVLANYAFWGALLADLPRFGFSVHRAVVMHDLLAEHVRMFRDTGLALDCNDISPEMEIRWLNGADTLIAVQRAEADAVRGLVRGTVLVQPIPLSMRPASSNPMPGRCLFVGSNSLPNLQGLEWLLQAVWPLVLAGESTATLAIVGTVCDGWRHAVPAGVALLGSVESLAAEHDQAAVCLVPLRAGSGIKIKLLDALSHGKATVATTVGVQGLEDWAVDTIEVADTAQAFAAAVLLLLRDDAFRKTRERAASALVQEHFGPGSAAERALLERLLHTE